jgi:alpha-glucosidase (family GH31 glycosyl hydrolase)
MFGSQILVSPKVNLKFILVDEVIILGSEEFQNTKSTPVYEVDPILPEKYYDWNTKVLIPAGQHQLFLSDAEIPMYIKTGTILPLLNVHEN